MTGDRLGDELGYRIVISQLDIVLDLFTVSVSEPVGKRHDTIRVEIPRES